jgi:tellurite resistance protein TerC
MTVAVATIVAAIAMIATTTMTTIVVFSAAEAAPPRRAVGAKAEMKAACRFGATCSTSASERAKSPARDFAFPQPRTMRDCPASVPGHKFVEDSLWWFGFIGFLLAMLALDLGVFHRKAHVITFREALAWSAVWVTIALIFNGIVYYTRGEQAALEFLTGYVIEKSLAVDNIFVFVMVFAYFQVPALYQHKVLFWGILGALAMRAGFIFAGIELIKTFHWTIYIFGALLVFTGIKMLWAHGKQLDPSKNPVIRMFRRFVPIADDYHGERFFLNRAGKWFATPLFVVLIFVEISDLIFAVDSIPAILAITDDAFIVFTSNALAILGLRSMYFAVGGLMQMFHYLHYGLSAILIFVGTKMLIADIYKVPTVVSLGVIVGVLALTIGVSWLRRKPTSVKKAAAEVGVEITRDAPNPNDDSNIERKQHA